MAIVWKLLLLGLVLSISRVNAAGKCKICDSTDGKCTSDPENLENKDCPNTDQCYVLVANDGSISRGCADATDKCTSVNCKTCDGSKTLGCNTLKIGRTCKNCDSSKDPNCSTWLDANAVENEICADGINDCIMQIKDNKHIERRCANKDEKCGEGKKCSICAESGCNKDVFPKDRRRCYQCETSPKCANPGANADIVSLPCTLYDEAEECFEYGTSSDAMARGCSSNATEIAECKKVNEKCFTCKDDNCNSDTYKITSSIKCIQCKEDDKDCAWGHTVSEAKDCEIEYWQPRGCYTNIMEAGKVERGCAHAAPQGVDCSAAASTCKSCTTSACNKDDSMEYSCYKCRSDENAKCALALSGESYTSGKCRNPVTQENQGCYTEKWGEIIIRSCLVDADVKTQKLCKDTNYKECQLCQEVNCNKDAPPGSAQGLVLGSGLLTMSLLVLKFM